MSANRLFDTSMDAPRERVYIPLPSDPSKLTIEHARLVFDMSKIPAFVREVNKRS